MSKEVREIMTERQWMLLLLPWEFFIIFCVVYIDLLPEINKLDNNFFDLI